jgi:hypothetical protein
MWSLKNVGGSGTASKTDERIFLNTRINVENSTGKGKVAAIHETWFRTAPYQTYKMQ